MWRCALVAGVALVGACKGQSSAASDPPAAVAKPDKVEQALAKIVATCAEADGSVEARLKGDPRWTPVAVGAQFRERDWVRTGEGAFARLRFLAGGFLDLREKTAIIIDAAITVDSGTLVGVAEKGAQPIIVKTADGSQAQIVASGDEQAEFRLTPGAGSLEIAVTKGSVDVRTGAGARTVTAGEATDVQKNASGEVVKLLPFPKSVLPGIDARFQYVAAMKINLVWKPVPKAARYRVQVARDTEFRALALDAEVPGSLGSFMPDRVGVYAWRAAAIDDRGRVGEFGFVRRIYVEAEAPHELLVGPAEGAKLGYTEQGVRVTFSWKSASEAAKYRLVIGAGADPTIDTVASIVTTGQQIEVKTLEEGTYRWGVYAITGKTETPIFLAPRHLTIRRQHVRAETDKLWDQKGR